MGHVAAFNVSESFPLCVIVVSSLIRRPQDYYTMELSEHAEGLSDL